MLTHQQKLFLRAQGLTLTEHVHTPTLSAARGMLPKTESVPARAAARLTLHGDRALAPPQC